MKIILPEIANGISFQMMPNLEIPSFIDISKYFLATRARCVRVDHAPEMEEEEETALLNFIHAAREEEEEGLSVNAQRWKKRSRRLPC